MNHEQDEPPVLGVGCWPPEKPSQEEAELAWRSAFAARLVELGIDKEDADVTAAAVEVDLAEDPVYAAENELDCWD